MRLWSLHPKYLDQQGLVALWREALLAQKVLQGKTKGYKKHPQLLRFKQQKQPLHAIGIYLRHVWCEARARGYRFERGKIIHAQKGSRKFIITVTRGQKKYELTHLKRKLVMRAPQCLTQIKKFKAQDIELHPLFLEINGPVEIWEVQS